MKNLNKLVEDDLRLIWHPAAQMKEYNEDFPPVPVVSGHGCYLKTANGEEILDIVSSWWCNLLGHCNKDITEALCEQAHTLEHVIFANLTHPWAVELARELLKILPPGLNHFNFGDNGSSSVEMALKMAFQYQYQTGNSKRIRFACLTEGYHGETIGALSVGSMDLYAKMYKPMMMNNLHIEAPDCFRCPYGCERCSCAIPCIEKARKAFADHGDELCALIVEPLLQGAAGMRMYPAAYLKALRQLCDDYEVLLITDEIATGFGRTGTMFACEQAGISPDIMTLSKAITGGYMPMSVVCTTEKVYRAFYADYEEGKAFVHSHTYAGNPLACSCALAVLKVLKRDHILEKAKENSLWLHNRFIEGFGSVDEVGEIRHLGLINAVELVSERKSKKPFDSELRVGFNLYREALHHGLLLRNIGDIFYFNPPLNIEREDLDKALNIAVKSLKKILADLL